MTTSDDIIATPGGPIAIRQSATSGFPLLLLHGTGTSGKVFARQFDSPLAARFRLIAIDLPGHGGSADAPTTDGYTLPGLAASVASVTAALGIEHCAIYGWSLGGHVATELLSYHPMVAGVMLGGAPPVAKGPFGLFRGFHPGFGVLLVSKPQFTERDVWRFAELCFGAELPPGVIDDLRRADGRCRTTFLASALRGIGADQRLTVERAQVPVALVNGEAEPFTRLAYLDTVHSRYLWEGKPVVIAGAAHAPFWQQPALFNTLLDRFADDVAAAAACPPLARRRAG